MTKKIMELDPWNKLLGKAHDDPQVRSALSSAHVTKAPRLERDRFDVVVDLKGYGMWLVMTDEAHFTYSTDHDIGEGPLILTQVGAYVVRKGSRDLYKGSFPYDIRAEMTRADARKLLGRPASSDEDPPYDSWLRDGLEVTARYSHGELKLRHSVSSCADLSKVSGSQSATGPENRT